ncbi:ArsR/SmtB family transcription factor [Rhodococcus sp. NPDC057014]|uniref:ArsR/SmtB family transcription factor n=1 Tax=Rhodococcus sp. NPDC057014 TaxID=3346000 RepID=UPI003639F7E8
MIAVTASTPGGLSSADGEWGAVPELSEQTVAQIAGALEETGGSRTAVSQHLAKLRFTGLVDTRKDGRRVIYCIHDGHFSRLVLEGINHADHVVSGPPHE